MENELEKIASFRVDHTKLQPGIYVSRVDGDVTTYDLRMRTPNAGDYLSDVAMHSFEHLLATYMRSGALADSVIYAGPMGCRTGFYLLMRNADNAAVLRELKDVLRRIAAHDGPMPGRSEIECGNYRELSLDEGKAEARRYLAVLEASEATFEYQN